MLEEAPAILELSQEGVAFVTLNRPHKKNALDEMMIESLSNIFETLRVSDNVRLVIIKGAGGNFCSGGDIEWLQRQARHDLEDNELDAFLFAQMLNRLYNLPQITLALIEGIAYGAATGIIAACDYAISISDAKFSFPETRIGIVPANIAPYIIEAIGVRAARALFLTAKQFDGEFAKNIGLVHEVVTDLASLSKAEENFANIVFSVSPDAVAKTKDLINHIKFKSIDASLIKETSKKMALSRSSIEGKEGLSAFLEKRNPMWKGN